jgi:hypothetical protein
MGSGVHVAGLQMTCRRKDDFGSRNPGGFLDSFLPPKKNRPSGEDKNKKKKNVRGSLAIGSPPRTLERVLCGVG